MTSAGDRSSLKRRVLAAVRSAGLRSGRTPRFGWQGLEPLEPRKLLSAAIDLTPPQDTGTLSEEAGHTVITLDQGGINLVITVNVTPSGESFNTFQLDFEPSDDANDKLVLSDWGSSGGFTDIDADLNAPGDSFVAGFSAADLSNATAVGTFTVAVPETPGDYLLSVDKASGVGAGTSISRAVIFPPSATPLQVTSFGDLVIRVPGAVVPQISISNASVTEGDVDPPTESTLEGTVRDFIGTGTTSPSQGAAAAHFDFENANFLNFRILNPNVIDPGIVADPLGVDGKPVFAGPTQTSSTADNFDQWYNDDPAVNASQALDLTLARDANDPSLYSFSAPAFFPIDNDLFGNTNGATLPGDVQVPPDHNWHFSYEGHAAFVHQPGQVITAGADDDLFLFINNQLVIDRGGVNIEITRTVNLDELAAELGLEVGQSYNLDLFYAERHTAGAILNLTTNFAFTAPGADPVSYAVFDVTLSEPTTVAVTVQYNTVSGSADAGDDFLATFGTLTFAPGQTAKKVLVPIIGDTAAEATENFTVLLGVPTNATIAGGSGVATVTDDDEASSVPTVTIEATDPSAHEIGPETGTFTITRTGDTGSDLTVNFTIEGTAGNGGDYTEIDVLAVIPAGQASVAITVTPISDNATAGNEADETVIIVLSPDANYLLGQDSQATVTINDDPTVTITAIDPTGDEPGNDLITFRISRNGPTESSLELFFTVAGTATEGVDYAAILPHSIAIPNGFSFIDLNPNQGIDDDVFEGDETIILTITPGAGFFIDGDGSATATLLEDDPPLPVVNIVATDATATETNSTTGTFTISRNTTGGSLLVFFQIGGTAASTGADYTALPLFATISAGENSTTVTVTPVDDDDAEGSETVVLTLIATENYTVGDNEAATVTIADNDDPGTASIAGKVFNDKDRDGVIDFDEVGVQTAKPFIDVNDNGVKDDGEPAILGTNNTGNYLLHTLPAGDYRVRVELPTGFILTAPAAGFFDISLDPAQNVTGFNFGATDEPLAGSPTVSIVAADASAEEIGGNTGTWIIARTNKVGDLTVLLDIGGTAEEGVDFQDLPASVVIPNGQNFVALTLTPIADDDDEPNETAIVFIVENINYSVAPPGGATINIIDSNPTQFDFEQATFSDPLAVDNPLLPLTPGVRSNFGGKVKNDQGKTVNALLTLDVTNDTQVIAGVNTRVVHTTVFHNNLLVQEIFERFAQDDAGNVWLFGSAVFNNLFTNGVVTGVNGNGTWLAGVGGAQPQMFMLANPQVGDHYVQALSPVDDVDEQAIVLSTTGTVKTKVGVFEDVLVIREFSPLDPLATENRHYAPGDGLVLIQTGVNAQNKPSGSLQLLSAGTFPNLVVDINDNLVLPGTVVPGDKLVITGTAQNLGGIPIDGSVALAIFLLPANQANPDNDDQPLSTINLKGAGLTGALQPLAWKANVTVPGDLDPGQVHFVAVIDSNEFISEPDHEDDNSDATAAVTLAFQLGAVPDHPKPVKKITVGGLTLSFTGTGTVTLIPGQGDDPPSIEVTTDTTGKSSLTVKEARNFDGRIMDLTLLAGTLKAANLKGIAIDGSVDAEAGLIFSLVAGAIADQHEITLGGAAVTGKETFSLTATTVADLSISSTIPIKSIKVDDWDDTDAEADLITAPSVGTVASKADFAADITVTDTTLKAAIKSVTAKAVLSSVIRSAGNIGAITAARIVDSLIFAGVDNDVTALPDSLGDFVDGSAATIAKVTAKGVKDGSGDSFVNSAIAAPSVGSVTLTDVDTDNDEVTFGVAATTLIKSVKRTGAVAVKNLATPGDTGVEGDFVLRIVGLV